jgi:hypothetical protein
VEDSKPKGNLMTQKYYTEQLLPHYIKKLQEESKHSRRAIFQEDNDSSHGTRSTNNVARELKKANSIETLQHPAQSPDLSPIEGIWNILKQQVRI